MQGGPKVFRHLILTAVSWEVDSSVVRALASKLAAHTGLMPD